MLVKIKGNQRKRGHMYTGNQVLLELFVSGRIIGTDSDQYSQTACRRGSCGGSSDKSIGDVKLIT